MSGVKWESGELGKADFVVTCHGNGGGHAKGGGREDRNRRESVCFGSGVRRGPSGWERKEAGILESPSCTLRVGLGPHHISAAFPEQASPPHPLPHHWVGQLWPWGQGLLKPVSVVWALLTLTCQGDQPGSFSSA